LFALCRLRVRAHFIGSDVTIWLPDNPHLSGWYISSTFADGAETVPAARTRAT
jgi:hypothetical protein